MPKESVAEIRDGSDIIMGSRAVTIFISRVTGLSHSFTFDRELSRRQDRNRGCVSVTLTDAKDGFVAR